MAADSPHSLPVVGCRLINKHVKLVRTATCIIVAVRLMVHLQLRIVAEILCCIICYFHFNCTLPVGALQLLVAFLFGIGLYGFKQPNCNQE